MRLVTAHTTKAISNEVKIMTVIVYGKSASAGNAKTRRHERRRKLAMERDAIGNIIDSIFGCDSPDAPQEVSRSKPTRVDRVVSSFDSYGRQIEKAISHHESIAHRREQKLRNEHMQILNESGRTIHAVQKSRGKSIPLI